MVTLDAIRKPIDASWTEFEEFVHSNFSSDDELLHDMLEYILSSRGKGLRPMIVMLSAAMNSACGTFGKRTYLAAMLTEMIHLASLIHDDVIDESDMRRGRKSVNARWQSRNAVIVGDYVLARNMSVGLRSGQFDLVTHIVGSMTTLCEGELIQSDHAAKLNLTRNEYFDIIRRKTASLLGVSASAGAVSVGAEPRNVQRMRLYGESLGMAFQIVDDILDYTPQNHTGKPAGNDLREHKITLPLLEVLERADVATRAELLAKVKECATDESRVDEVIGYVQQHDGVRLAYETAQKFLLQASSQLVEYADSPYRTSLVNLCAYVAQRDK